MSNHMITNNQAVISGEIMQGIRSCPGNYWKNFCMINVAVKRLSGFVDYIPVMISKKMVSSMQDHVGRNIWVSGRFMSYIYNDSDGSHVSLSLFASAYAFQETRVEENINIIFLDGYISSPPVYRITPLGCKITELTIAMNYAHFSSDYLPCICWNKNALAAALIPCGTHIQAYGRIQSREYAKKINDLEICKTAYEISIWKIVHSECLFINEVENET